jgi:hypothetical protein
VVFTANATRTVSSFAGNLRGNITLKRPPGSTAAVQWQYVGVVVKQVSRIIRKGYANAREKRTDAVVKRQLQQLLYCRSRYALLLVA